MTAHAASCGKVGASEQVIQVVRFLLTLLLLGWQSATLTALCAVAVAPFLLRSPT